MATRDPAELKGRRLGRVLTKLGKVTREQVHEGLALQRTRKEPIGALLVGLGYITEIDVLEALAGQAGMAMVDLEKTEIDDETIAAIPPETATTYQVVPIAYDAATRRVTIAMKSPDNYRAVDDLRLLMGFKVNAVVALPEQIDAVIKKRYAGRNTSLATVYAEVSESSSLAALQGRGDSIDLAALSRTRPTTTRSCAC